MQSADPALCPAHSHTLTHVHNLYLVHCTSLVHDFVSSIPWFFNNLFFSTEGSNNHNNKEMQSFGRRNPGFECVPDLTMKRHSTDFDHDNADDVGNSLSFVSDMRGLSGTRVILWSSGQFTLNPHKTTCDILLSLANNQTTNANRNSSRRPPLWLKGPCNWWKKRGSCLSIWYIILILISWLRKSRSRGKDWLAVTQGPDDYC